MHRDSADPANMQLDDFLCDFCAQPWSEDRPFVEGHRGSCICGQCLTLAFADIAIFAAGTLPPEGQLCTLCLESKPDTACWQSPLHEDKLACKVCIKRAAGVLHKDPDIEWTKPALSKP